VETTKHTLKACKKKTISMKWKEDPSKDNQGPGEAKNGVGEGRDPTKNQNDSVQAEDNNSRQQEKKTVVTASRRSRKIPVTRRDDFLWTATNKKTVKVEKKKIKDSSQVPQNKSLKIFHQNIRGLGNKANEFYCHLHHDLPHILCLSEHHLSESELKLSHLTNCSLAASYCRKTFLRKGLSIFVYRCLKYNTINTDEYNRVKDTEACSIPLDSIFNKLCILAIYRSPRCDFTNFLKQLELILQKLYNKKYNIIMCGAVNVNYLIDNN